MRKIHLLNAAVMPCEGVYVLKKITADEFKESVIDADTAGILEHYIGYESTLNWLSCGQVFAWGIPVLPKLCLKIKICFWSYVFGDG